MVHIFCIRSDIYKDHMECNMMECLFSSVKDLGATYEAASSSLGIGRGHYKSYAPSKSRILGVFHISAQYG